MEDDPYTLKDIVILGAVPFASVVVLVLAIREWLHSRRLARRAFGTTRRRSRPARTNYVPPYRGRYESVSAEALAATVNPAVIAEAYHSVQQRQSVDGESAVEQSSDVTPACAGPKDD